MVADAQHVILDSKNVHPLTEETSAAELPAVAVRYTMKPVAVGVPRGDSTRHVGARIFLWNVCMNSHGIAAYNRLHRRRMIGHPLVHSHHT